MRHNKLIMLALSSLLVFSAVPLTISADNATDNEADVTAAETTEQIQDIGQFSTKDEVIYGKLAANGHPHHLYVVNSFYLTEPGDVIDYGNYQSVQNLTNLAPIEQVGNNQVRFTAEEEFYYQGELETTTLPWDIEITYLLDGAQVDPSTLAGATGLLEIQIETTANTSFDPVFFDYYLLQISLTLDPLVFSDIVAPKASIANAGKNKLLAFSVMPGKEEQLIVSAHVENLTLDPIEIAAIPANIAFDNPDTDDLTGDISELAEAIGEINQGVGELKAGVSALRGGATELSNGSTAFQSGLTELNASSAPLVSGSADILAGLKQINAALANGSQVPDLSELSALPAGLYDMADGIAGLGEVVGALQEAIANVPAPTITEEDIGALYALLAQVEAEAAEDPEREANPRLTEVVTELSATYEAAQTIVYINDMFPDNVTGVIDMMASNLREIAAGVEAALANLDQLSELEQLFAGLTTLATEYNTFHNGLVSYTGGVSQLATSYKELNNGTKQVTNGIRDLESGATELHNGTQELAAETSDLPEQIKSEIDKFMEEFDYSGYEPTSFVSDKNNNVSVVQFVLQTERIELPAPEEVPEEEPTKPNLWNRFLDLFR